VNDEVVQRKPGRRGVAGALLPSLHPSLHSIPEEGQRTDEKKIWREEIGKYRGESKRCPVSSIKHDWFQEGGLPVRFSNQ